MTEYLGGICTDDGVKGGIGIPGLDSFLVGFSTDTEVIGLDSVPAERAPAGEHPAAPGLRHHGRHRHGDDRCSGSGSGSSGGESGDIPQTKWFLRAVAVSGVAAIVAMECGWIVTEVGRQPWVVYGVMRTEDAITGAEGVWVTFSIVLVLYTLLGVATVVVLRRMARALAESRRRTTVDVPYGPRDDPPLSPAARHEQGRRSRRRAVDRGHPLRGLRRRRLRRRVLGAPRRRSGSGASGPAR